MKKETVHHLHWLLGGIIGVVLGLLFSMYFIFHLDMPDPDVYAIVYHICASIIIVSVFLGAAFGTTVGKIVVLLEDVYIQPKKQGKTSGN